MTVIEDSVRLQKRLVFGGRLNRVIFDPEIRILDVTVGEGVRRDKHLARQFYEMRAGGWRLKTKTIDSYNKEIVYKFYKLPA